ncbi:MAG: Bifunctional phosphoglucose/phosphomannose isomerase [Candidatus Nomurabacteria bacterium GW2011_GWE1_32_28]|uniref:Bifunctional phosphoglucose/phosphomannose isomerase n=1 Tax=Candidatus Nomurabacteria bacterium GW2011_GWF1_31_48 TaxID=1618767 RepID=A0A0G0BGT8_9BACT|nr:MAG: Bifunctional phosphoglucose/phosphomannose isomerase [Candidatus Nomurabacteria bacterium GW2011_GWF2_30_133]KKP28680.1 MAG: Bifunctional phosphoglucose/phosphomannose isomerase [Candidatus Nomurabacteria bacterium GW2011_GWE2_31_40]KKP30257.1 MAG: Bifunctional phosphoglucose/phosphomannose isomerase [Candidatus Nomurabacteria bacterium GW2011_GWF1_31_48]KKP34784.1 MAG: Bifunctional phosphoglucose/phosphomannose isomerase [Candidatus Nomurabacteria bacterium GW2011_GWE1_32_28]HAS80758.1
MYESIKNFNKQFLYEPETINEENLFKKSNFIVVGMGGSALAPLLLKKYKPEISIMIHNNYGLPQISKKELENSLIILSSYSGNTEEVLDAFQKAKENNLSMAVISVGGKLLSLAKENGIPYIKLPNTGIQPRMALGYSIKAFLKLIGDEDGLKEISKLSEILNPNDYEETGKIFAKKLKNYVPIIYTSSNNLSIVYNWKIKLNETGKIPSFYNVLPELNHNEMTGFDVVDATKELSNKFYFIILKDEEDDERIINRMNILEKLYKDRNLKVEIIEIKGNDIWHKIFSSLVLADWTAYYTALEYEQDPEQVPMVEELKKLITK